MAYEILQSRIELEPFEPFHYVCNVEVRSSWRNLTDTATLQLPRTARLRDSDLRETLRVGQFAKIDLRYVGQNFLRIFDGYIVEIKPESPMIFELEDAMWLLKQKTFSATYAESENVTVEKMAKEMLRETGLGSIPFEMLGSDLPLGEYRIDRATPAKVFADLRTRYGLCTYFRDGKLLCGLPYIDGSISRPDQTVSRSAFVFHFQKNIYAHSLKYVRATDRKLKVKATSFLDDKKTLTVEVGDADGETRTLHYFNISDESVLRGQALNDLRRMKVEGYAGAFVTDGRIPVRFGEVVELQDDLYPERGGRYVVDAVKTTFGENGYRQEISLGGRVSV